MYSLRLCTPSDAPVVADFVVQFCEESYNHIQSDFEKIIQTVDFFLEGDGSRKIVIGLCYNDVLVGILAGIAQELIFSTKLVANEMMWWVEPHHRNRHGLKLISAFEFWAQKIGCVNIHLSNVQGDKLQTLNKFYERRGYSLLEQSFVKVL